MQNQKSNKKSKNHTSRNAQTKQPTAAANAAADAAVEAFQRSDSGPIQTDVLGSYTGMSADPTDPKPEQDADDL